MGNLHPALNAKKTQGGVKRSKTIDSTGTKRCRPSVQKSNRKSKNEKKNEKINEINEINEKSTKKIEKKEQEREPQTQEEVNDTSSKNGKSNLHPALNAKKTQGG